MVIVLLAVAAAACDADLTRAFLTYAAAHVRVGPIHVDDPDVHEAIAAVTPAPRHDDHIHLCFAAE